MSTPCFNQDLYMPKVNGQTIALSGFALDPALTGAFIEASEHGWNPMDIDRGPCEALPKFLASLTNI
jgi:hypothetical protein